MQSWPSLSIEWSKAKYEIEVLFSVVSFITRAVRCIWTGWFSKSWFKMDVRHQCIYMRSLTETLFLSGREQKLYEYRNMWARRGSQIVPIEMPNSICWKTFPAKITKILLNRNSREKNVWIYNFHFCERGGFRMSYLNRSNYWYEWKQNVCLSCFLSINDFLLNNWSCDNKRNFLW